MNKEIASNRSIERVIKKFDRNRSRASPSKIVNSVWGSSLYELSDAPFEVDDTPTVMTAFRTKMEKNCEVPPCVETFGKKHVCSGIPDALSAERKSAVPDLEDLGYGQGELTEFDERSSFPFRGGEDNALQR